MFDWLFRRQRHELPEYARLRSTLVRTVGSSSFSAPDDVLQVWSIIKAGELARADLYFGYALEAARSGKPDIAREVAIETVGHVTAEDPRVHLLLGQLAVALEDRPLLREAQEFLIIPSTRRLGAAPRRRRAVRCT